MTKLKQKKIYTGSQSGSNTYSTSGNSFNLYSKSNYWAWQGFRSYSGTKCRLWTIK